MTHGIAEPVYGSNTYMAEIYLFSVNFIYHLREMLRYLVFFVRLATYEK